MYQKIGTSVNAWTRGPDPLYGPCVCFLARGWSLVPQRTRLLKGVEGSGVVLPRVPEDGTALVLQRHRLGFEVFVQSFLP